MILDTQAEYVREGIDWRYIEFVDNQEVLDLMEGRMGLLDLLDEQCRFPTVSWIWGTQKVFLTLDLQIHICIHYHYNASILRRWTCWTSSALW